VFPWLSETEVRKSVLSSGDLSGNSSDNDIHYERIGQLGGGKYLRESYYHRIECSIANSLATLMRK